jgi:hypothetical protein
LIIRHKYQQAWLAGRAVPESLDKVTISAPENLRSIGFPDLILEKAGPEHQETLMNCHDFQTQKPKNWTELSHLVDWSFEFIKSLKNNRSSLSTLELLRGANEYPISLARFHVEESIKVVQSAVTFESGLDFRHPDTHGSNYAVNNILIEDSTCLHDIVRQAFACLYSRCVVRLVVKTNSYYSAIITAYLVDLMHSSGASKSEVSCVAFDRRESIGNEKFAKSLSPNKQSKLSTIATVFKQTDTFAAAQGIIESYFRDQYPNLIILVEESAYDRFVQDWQRYYSHAMHIGTRLDERTTVVDSFNEKVHIDLAAIDIKASHKMHGHVINVLRFRTLSELTNLLGNLRKVPYLSIWNDDVLLSREFCLRLNLCGEFWINHAPKSLTYVKFTEDMLNYYYDTVAEDMTYIYNSVYASFADEAETLRKTQATFLKKDGPLRTSLVLQAFISIITKCKSLRNGSTVQESVAKLKRFQRANLLRMSTAEDNNSRVETHSKPVGLAILMVREDNSIKNKPALLEFIFNNLLLGNAVLLSCPPNTLGARFAMDNDHVIPFKMVHDSLPDISRLSLDASIEQSELSISKKQCPKNTYAIEILPEMSSEQFETIAVALGTRRKSIWYPDVEQSNYWTNE